MAIKDIFKVNRKTFVDPAAWVGYDSVKMSTQVTWNFIKGLITPATAERTETFEQAMQRLNVTESSVHQTSQRFLLYAIVFFVLAVCALLYGVYLLINNGMLTGFLFAIATTVLLLSQAFRYHFWHYQIKHRKLGCTFAEWKRSLFSNDEGSK